MPEPSDGQVIIYPPAPAQPETPHGGPLVGLLKAEGGLDWPLALRILPPAVETRELRERIDSQASEVQRQAAEGQVDGDLLRRMSEDVARLREVLAEREGSLPVSDQAMADAGRFLRKVREALRTR
jgi:hypothetical protein